MKYKYTSWVIKEMKEQHSVYIIHERGNNINKLSLNLKIKTNNKLYKLH